MRHGKLHAGLLCAMFVIAIAAMATLGNAGTDWNGTRPVATSSPLPPAPGSPTAQVATASADTSSPKGLPVQPTTECAVQCVQTQCVQQVQCIQTHYVPVRTVRTYNVASAAPVANVGCAGRARIGILNRFRARRSLFRANAHVYASTGCGG